MPKFKLSSAIPRMIASLGAAWCAAFLWKRAGSSGHAMSAVGYALVNWLQSVLATLISASKPWGCSYAFLTAHIDPKVAASKTIGFYFLRAEWVFLYPWNMILPLRILFYLAALVWMQVLVQRRIHALEKTSGRCYNAGSIMKMLKVQFFSIGFGAFLSCLTFLVLISLSESDAFATSLTVAMYGGFCIVAIFLVGNVLAAVKAVCSLAKSAKDVQSILGSEMLHHAPEEVKNNLKDASRQTQLQAVAVFLSFLVSAVVVPCVVMQMDDTFSYPASSTVYPDDNVGAVLLGVFVQAIDVVGNGLIVVLLCGAHRVSEQSSQCLHPPKAICTSGVHRKDEGWKKKVEDRPKSKWESCSNLEQRFSRGQFCKFVSEMCMLCLKVFDHLTRLGVVRSWADLEQLAEVLHGGSSNSRWLASSSDRLLEICARQAQDSRCGSKGHHPSHGTRARALRLCYFLLEQRWSPEGGDHGDPQLGQSL